VFDTLYTETGSFVLLVHADTGSFVLLLHADTGSFVLLVHVLYGGSISVFSYQLSLFVEVKPGK
jgi:hypothetical protein